MRGRRVLVATTVACAFVLRLAHLLAMRSNPLFERPIMDALMHDTWARGLLSGTWPPPEPFFRAPLYPYLLAGLYGICDADRFAVQLVHILISAVGAGAAAYAADHLWGRRAGWSAGVLFATLWTSIYFSAELLIVTLPVTLNLLALGVLVGGDVRVNPPRVLTAGFLLGLSAISRPNILIVIPIVLAFLAFSVGRRTPWRLWLFLLLGLAVPILPVTVSNVVRGGDSVLISSQGGVNFYIGNNADSDGRTAVVPGTRPTWQGGFDDTIAMAERDAGRTLKPSEVDRYFLRKGLAFWIEEPGQAVALYGKKLRMLFGAGERSNNKFIYAWRDWSPILKLPFLAGWPLVLALGVLGAFVKPLRPGGRLLVLGMAAAYAVSVLLFFVNARFRLPVAALLVVPAGAGVDYLWRIFRGRLKPVPLIPLLIAALVGGLSLADLLDFKERRTDANPFHAFTLGNAYADLGDDTRAVAAWREALTIQQRYPQKHFEMISGPLYKSLSSALAQMSSSEDALAVAAAWVRDGDGDRESRLWYGNMLLEAGQTDQASAQFEFLLRADPDDPGALLGNAWVLQRNGQTGTALRRFRQLISQGDDPRAEFGVGLCLIELEQLQGAERAFLNVVRLEPTSWQAWGNLAGIYERTGRIDEAGGAYGQLLRLRPGDARAREWLSAHPATAR